MKKESMYIILKREKGGNFINTENAYLKHVFPVHVVVVVVVVVPATERSQK